MAQTVQLPDSSIASFPDDMSPESIEQAVQTHVQTSNREAYHNRQSLMVNTVRQGAYGAVDNAIDLAASLEAKGLDALTGSNTYSQAYQNSSGRKEVQDTNTELAGNVAALNKETGTVGIPLTDIHIGGGDIAQGVGATPAITTYAGPVSKLASSAVGAAGSSLVTEGGNWFQKGLSMVAGKFAPWLAGSATAGGTVGALAPANGETVDQSLEQRGKNAKLGAEIGVVTEGAVNAVGTASNAVKEGLATRSAEGAKQQLGTAFNKVIGPEGTQALEDYTSTPVDQRPYDLTSAEVLQNPDVATLQRQSSSVPPYEKEGRIVNPANEAVLKNQTNKNKLATELENLNAPGANTQGLGKVAESQINTEKANIADDLTTAEEAHTQAVKTNEGEASNIVLNAPTKAEANTAIGTKARDTLITERQKVNSYYDKIDPNGTLKAPATVAKDAIENVNDTSAVENDKLLSGIAEKYTSEEPISVNDRIQDKNKLSAYVSDINTALKDKPGNQELVAKRDTAIEFKNALVKDIGSLDNLPAANGKSVPEAFKEAENKFIEFNKNYLEDTSQYSGVSKEGKTYGNSSSTLGDYDVKRRAGSASSLGEEGAKLLNTSKPEAFSADLANIKHFPDASATVTDRILGDVKDNLTSSKTSALDAFDKVYTPDIENSLKEHGFEQEASELQALRKQLFTSKNNVEKQASLLESSKELAETRLRNLQNTSAYKLLDKASGTALPPEQQIDRLLSDKTVQQDALKMAFEQEDNGATVKGIGQASIDRIKQLIEKTSNIKGEVNKTFDYKAFQTELDKHRTLLESTVPDELKQLELVNDVAKKLNFVHDISKGPQTSVKPVDQPETVEDIALKDLAIKGLKTPASIASGISRIFKGESTAIYRQIREDALQNPDMMLSLIKAAQDKGEQGIAQWVKDYYPTAMAAAFEGVKGNSSKKKLDNQVQDVLQSKKVGGSNEKLSNQPSGDARPDNGSARPKIVPVGPQSSNIPAGDSHAAIIQEASKLTGMPSRYFSAVQGAETKGKLNPDIIGNDAGASSARGRYQILTSTYNQISKAHPEANLGQVTPKNEGTASDPRHNERNSTVAAGFYGSDNKKEISRILGRPATYGDVYGAHHFGLDGFAKLMSAKPSSIAANILPKAAGANPGIFYDPTGKARSVRQVYKELEKRVSNV